jgi:hypothetical protein
MDLAPILMSQYMASLEMLKQTITQCPELIWNTASDKNRFWQVAYHALFFTHLYLGESEEAFAPWSKHRDGYGDFPAPENGEPYDKDAILEYLAFCQQEVRERVPQLHMEAMAAFHRRSRSTLELQIYSIRHIMQHTGELMERLGTRADVQIDWVGSKHG